MNLMKNKFTILTQKKIKEFTKKKFKQNSFNKKSDTRAKK